MVDVMGHLAMALLVAAPAWVLWDGRLSLAFVGLTLTTAMLPDADLYLQGVLPITHHGVTHTVVFVTAVALVAGAVVEFGLRSWLERTWLASEGYAVSDWALFAFVAGAFVLGGCSHLVADMLSAPDIAAPVEPFWPVFEKPWSVDVLYYDNPWWNRGLLAVATALHLALGYLDYEIGHRYRMREDGA